MTDCPNCPSKLAHVRECHVHGTEVYCEMCGTRNFCDLGELEAVPPEWKE